MLSLFPHLLDYQFFVPTFLRIASALTLFYIAYRFAITRTQIARTRLPIVGHLPEWASLFGALVITVAAVLLLIGLYTQAAAIVGMIIGLKHVVFERRYPSIMPLSSGAGALLFVICSALLFLGAGAFALDMPL